MVSLVKSIEAPATPAAIVEMAVRDLEEFENLEDLDVSGDEDVTDAELRALVGDELSDIVEEAFDNAPDDAQVTLAELANDVLADVGGETASEAVELSADVIAEMLAASGDVVEADAETKPEPEPEPEPKPEPAIIAGSWAGAETKPKTETKTETKGKDGKTGKKAKAPPTPRLTTGKPSDVIRHCVGAKLPEKLALELSDAPLSAEELSAKAEELLAAIDTCKQIKVREKAIIFSKWLANGGALCRVIQITFETLARDGKIVTGDKGNLVQALLRKPYSIGTARAQSGQMHVMLPLFKIASRVGNQIVLNPNSAAWLKAKIELSL
jgi:hypothetical protein